MEPLHHECKGLLGRHIVAGDGENVVGARNGLGQHNALRRACQRKSEWVIRGLEVRFEIEDSNSGLD